MNKQDQLTLKVRKGVQPNHNETALKVCNGANLNHNESALQCK